MSDCIFCAIARGEQNAHKIDEDEHSVAFLDLHPLRDGHTLVIPKAHYRHLQDVAPEELGPLFSTVQRAAQAVQSAMDAPAATIGIHNGSEAGQAVPHLHVHIIPRHRGDGGGTLHHVVPGQTDLDLDTVQARIDQAIGAL
jgi:histidine triad (HIT) family protein